MKTRRILIIEPFLTGSHAQWLEEYRKYSRHNISVLSLPGRNWKWRMHGAAVTLAKRFLNLNEPPHVIVATDMLDVATFVSLTRHRLNGCAVLTYFHENQLTYPWSKSDPDIHTGRDEHYGFINYTSALVSDGVIFNSRYHRDSFLSALPDFLNRFPDHRELENIEVIRKKSTVLYPGIDTDFIDSVHPPDSEDEPPLVIWNHRWEYDKNPDEFFQVLESVMNKQIPFRLAVLGESYAASPEIFCKLSSIFGHRLIYQGYADNRAEYIRWLKCGKLLPVTSNQDFFGISILEAIYSGCTPLLPHRLTYPELIPHQHHNRFIYRDIRDLQTKIENLLTGGYSSRMHGTAPSMVKPFSWNKLAPEYDDYFSGFCPAE